LSSRPDGQRRAGRGRAIIGIDTGGTFTDFILVDRSGARVLKVLSTPADPSRAVRSGLSMLLGDAVAARITYGSTVATNALLQRSGARVCLVTTRGFEDVIEIGRQARPELYALEPRPPRPLVGRADRIGVAERVAFDGRRIVPLTRRAIASVLRRVRLRRPEAVAVALLHSYANPAHERALGRALAALGVPISLSAGLVREDREYERTSTTVLNAYVAPAMSRHLTRVAASARRAPMLVMQSNGGAVAASLAAREPVRTILSGPAGGVIGAVQIATRAGLTRILTLDMGGTSTDVALVDGTIAQRRDWTIEGMAVRVPAIDIHTVGAGGGSIARRDAGGLLAVGPESAGADPGPACYGRGTEPTVTDANLVLGRLDPSEFLGGELRVDGRRAAVAIARLASVLGISRLRAAEGVVRVANAAMARALRKVSVERGHDPRDFVLVAFGGAAGVHACELAAALGVREVLVPHHPGVLSAAGIGHAHLARDRALTVRAIGPPIAMLLRLLAPIRRHAIAELRAEGARGRLVARAFAQVRYSGQAHEIEVPLVAAYRRLFDAAHQRLYGHAAPDRPVEVVALRMTVTDDGGGRRPRRSPRMPPARTLPTPGSHVFVWQGRRRRAARYARATLAPGSSFKGPALLVEYSSTVLVPPGWQARVDAGRNLRLSR